MKDKDKDKAAFINSQVKPQGQYWIE